MKEYQSQSHTRSDCKYHVVFIPKRRKKRVFWRASSSSWGGVSRVGLAQGVEDCGGAHEGRSQAHVPEHSTEVRCLERGGVSEVEECVFRTKMTASSD